MSGGRDQGQAPLRDGCPSPEPSANCSVELDVSSPDALVEILDCIGRLAEAAKSLIRVREKQGKIAPGPPNTDPVTEVPEVLVAPKTEPTPEQRRPKPSPPA